MIHMIARRANNTDTTAMMQLIRELAEFEKEPDAVTLTEQQLELDGFSDTPLYHAFVAEENNTIAGLALVYFRYSTWKGKSLYLEDLIITEHMRKKGAGTMLFEACLNFAKSSHCVQMNWQVLDWNRDAINFYKKWDTDFSSEWINGSLKL